MVKKTKETNVKEIEKIVLEVAIEIAKSGEGALFVIGENVKYENLMTQKFQKFSVFDKGSKKLLKSLGMIDGAMIINSEGDVIEYGAQIKTTSILKGYGTRHSAALSASKGENIAILCSEEERKVKIFQNGKYVMQVDSLNKEIEKEIPFVVEVLESVGAGTIGAVGVAALAPALGFALVPGVLIFGGSYFLIKKVLLELKK